MPNIELSHNELLIRLKTICFDILGPANLNSLGIFEFLQGNKVISTAPAIRISFPSENTQPIYRMKVGSGIQCIVDTAPFFNHQKQGNNLVRTHHYYSIILDQYNTRLGLFESVDALVKMPNLYLFGEPIISPVRIDADKGTLPARAIIYVQRITIKESYF
jgi:hypothetical protein